MLNSCSWMKASKVSSVSSVTKLPAASSAAHALGATCSAARTPGASVRQSAEGSTASCATTAPVRQAVLKSLGKLGGQLRSSGGRGEHAAQRLGGGRPDVAIRIRDSGRQDLRRADQRRLLGLLLGQRLAWWRPQRRQRQRRGVPDGALAVLGQRGADVLHGGAPVVGGARRGREA